MVAQVEQRFYIFHIHGLNFQNEAKERTNWNINKIQIIHFFERKLKKSLLCLLLFAFNKN